MPDVAGAGRRRYESRKARHDQRTPFPARAIHEEYLAALRRAAGVAFSPEVGYAGEERATEAQQPEE